MATRDLTISTFAIFIFVKLEAIEGAEGTWQVSPSAWPFQTLSGATKTPEEMNKRKPLRVARVQHKDMRQALTSF